MARPHVPALAARRGARLARKRCRGPRVYSVPKATLGMLGDEGSGKRRLEQHDAVIAFGTKRSALVGECCQGMSRHSWHYPQPL